MTRNMELRMDLAPVPDAQMAMVLAANQVGLDATFAGSGGAIVGVFDDDDDLLRLEVELADLDCVVVPIETFTYRPLN